MDGWQHYSAEGAVGVTDERRGGGVLGLRRECGKEEKGLRQLLKTGGRAG
jgi:hypothetical protein